MFWRFWWENSEVFLDGFKVDVTVRKFPNKPFLWTIKVWFFSVICSIHFLIYSVKFGKCTGQKIYTSLETKRRPKLWLKLRHVAFRPNFKKLTRHSIWSFTPKFQANLGPTRTEFKFKLPIQTTEPPCKTDLGKMHTNLKPALTPKTCPTRTTFQTKIQTNM